MLEDNILLGSSYSDYYAVTQSTFNTSIESDIIYKTHLPKQKKDIADKKMI